MPATAAASKQRRCTCERHSPRRSRFVSLRFSSQRSEQRLVELEAQSQIAAATRVLALGQVLVAEAQYVVADGQPQVVHHQEADFRAGAALAGREIAVEQRAYVQARVPARTDIAR